MSKLSKVTARPTQQTSQQAVQPPLPGGQTAASLATSQQKLRHMKGVPVAKGQTPPTQLATVENTNPTDGIAPKFIGGTQLLPSPTKSFDGLNATQTNGAAGIASPSIAVNLGYAVVWGPHLGGPSIWGPFSSCSLALNSVTRGSIWCAAEYVGSDNWNTRIFAIRME
jgi:hypothetical protein